MPGYSGTPLAKKLGYKQGARIYLDGAPAEYRSWLAELPGDVSFLRRPAKDLDLIHVFCTKAADLERKLAEHQSRIAQNGMIWVSWPKKASKVPSDITEDVIRELALP